MSTDDHFKLLVRHMHNFIRSLHHFNYVNGSDSTKSPIRLQRTAKMLEAEIRPAMPTEATGMLLYGNARNWLCTGIQVLEEHYVEALTNTQWEILDLPLDRWTEAWEVAIRWAKKNLNRLTDDTVEAATQEMKRLVLEKSPRRYGPPTASTPGEEQPPPPEHPQPEPSDGATTGPQLQSTQLNDTQTIQNAPTSTPPTTVDYRSAMAPGPLTEDLSPIIPSVNVSCIPDTVRPKVGLKTKKTPNLKKTRVRSATPFTDFLFSQEAGTESALTTTQNSPKKVVTPQPSNQPPDTRAMLPQPPNLPEIGTVPVPDFSLRVSPGFSDLLTQTPKRDAPPKTRPDQTTSTPTGGKKAPYKRLRLNLGDPQKPAQSEDTRGQAASPEPQTGPQSAPEPLYTRHEHHGNKYSNWGLTPQRPIIIMGDSNLSRLPVIRDSRIQVDAYPGARIGHAIHILRFKTPPSPNTQKVILSFGLNHRDDSNASLLEANLATMVAKARATFPYAQLYIPLLNFNRTLPVEVKRRIQLINSAIWKTNLSIPALSVSKFRTTADKVHWTAETAEEILQHWLHTLNA